MKSVALVVAGLALVLGIGLVASGVPAGAPTAHAAGNPPMPEATKKKTPKATAKPSSATPIPTAAARRPIDEEGDRWVQLAVVGGGGLIACVLVFFGIGALMRRRPRRR